MFCANQCSVDVLSRWANVFASNVRGCSPWKDVGKEIRGAIDSSGSLVARAVLAPVLKAFQLVARLPNPQVSRQSELSPSGQILEVLEDLGQESNCIGTDAATLLFVPELLGVSLHKVRYRDRTGLDALMFDADDHQFNGVHAARESWDLADFKQSSESARGV